MPAAFCEVCLEEQELWLHERSDGTLIEWNHICHRCFARLTPDVRASLSVFERMAKALERLLELHEERR